jgi:hypothetical protein
MRARLTLLPVLAALPFLSGCLWWGYGAGAGASGSGTATLEAPAEAPAMTDAEAAVRATIPMIEAYYADNQTYAGVEDLEELYGVPFGDVRVIVRKKGQAYCVEAPSGAPSAHYAGPSGPVAPGPC